MHTKPPLPTLTLLPILLLLIISKSASPTPQSHPTTTTTTTTTSLPRPATPTPQPLLPRRCRSCPQNNTLGQTCYKNTLCIPLSLLCTPLPSSSTNTSLPLSSPCPDLPSFQLPGAGTTNPTPEPGSVLCSPDTNLCQDPQFLPLPAPGEGNIRRDTSSSSSCLKGSFFSLYPSSSAGVNGAGGSGNGNEGVQQKYIQSCIVSTPPNNNAGGQQPPCQDWEYRVGNSCLLRLCGGPPSSQELSCVLPYTCRKPIPSSTPSSPDTSVYGVCSNPTHPNPDDGDPSASPSNTPTAPQSSRSKKELILFNLLIALCSLVGLTALLFLLHHLRKRYLQRQGRYLPWTRQDKVHFLQALICRREMGELWEERRERLKVLQERELKWKPATIAGGGQRRGESNGEGGSQESVAMYDLHPGTTTSTHSRSTRALPQQSSPSSSIHLPTPTTSTTITTTTTTTTTPTHPTIPPPIHLLPSLTSPSSDNNLRPISHTDSESTDTSSSSQAIMMTHQSRRHRSVLDIFARRWQQPQFQLQQQLLHDGQQQGSRIREEVEPPPLYHQGPDLPAYRVRSPEPVQEPASRDQE